MFVRFAAFLDIAFKWLPMFDLDQTFSSNILLHEQMFDRLAISADKATNQNRIRVTSLHNFSDNTQKSLCGLI